MEVVGERTELKVGIKPGELIMVAWAKIIVLGRCKTDRHGVKIEKGKIVFPTERFVRCVDYRGWDLTVCYSEFALETTLFQQTNAICHGNHEALRWLATSNPRHPLLKGELLRAIGFPARRGENFRLF